jgi:hypothetical protein
MITSPLFLATLLAVGLPVGLAQAQSARTFVSAARGDDLNTCASVATPCRTFQAAHNKTLSDGEVTVLDPGGYGGLVITKSISIVNDGVGEASVLVSGGATGITVNAPDGVGYVNLRGITIQGIGFGGGTGLLFNTGFALTITNCLVRNHTGNGIELLPHATSHIAISDTLAADNGGSGIFMRPTGTGATKLTLSRVVAANNSLDGVFVSGQFAFPPGTIDAVIADSKAVANGSTGFNAFSTGGHGTTSMMLVRSVAMGNGLTGISASSIIATLRLARSTVTGNAASWTVANNAVLASFGDNYINGNGDGDPPIPTILARK